MQVSQNGQNKVKTSEMKWWNKTKPPLPDDIRTLIARNCNPLITKMERQMFTITSLNDKVDKLQHKLKIANKFIKDGLDNDV